jgi:hypothetical protein
VVSILIRLRTILIPVASTLAYYLKRPVFDPNRPTDTKMKKLRVELILQIFHGVGLYSYSCSHYSYNYFIFMKNLLHVGEYTFRPHLTFRI